MISQTCSLCKFADTARRVVPLIGNREDDEPRSGNAGTVIVPARGLLLDADGVLLDSDASVERAWNRWAHRWDLDPAAVLPLVHGRRSADTVALLIDHADRARAVADVDRYEVADADTVSACPGAAELLTA